MFTLRDHGMARIQSSATRGLPVYALAFAGTYSIYLRRDGQAELIWGPAYI